MATESKRDLVLGTAGHIDHGKIHLGPGAHRHRPGQVKRGEAARHHHRARLRPA